MPSSRFGCGICWGCGLLECTGMVANAVATGFFPLPLLVLARGGQKPGSLFLRVLLSVQPLAFQWLGSSLGEGSSKKGTKGLPSSPWSQKEQVWVMQATRTEHLQPPSSAGSEVLSQTNPSASELSESGPLEFGHLAPFLRP